MWIFLFITAIISALLHYHYVSSSYKHIPWITHALLVFSIFTCIAPFPLLVLDVDAALSVDSGSHVTKSVFHTTALPTWFFLFIASQVMAWIALPIAQAYDCGGEFNAWERFKGAVKVNVKMYIVLGVLVGALLGYVMFLKNVRDLWDVVHVTIAAANAFGLFLLVVFLACGLLGVPRRLWKMSDPETLLEEEYRKARRLHDELDVAKTDVILLRAEARSLLLKYTSGGVRDTPPGTAAAAVAATAAGGPVDAVSGAGEASVQENIQGILDFLTEFEKEVPLHQHGSERPDDRKSRTLVELNEDIISAIKVCRRLNFQWHECVQTCIQLSNVVAGTEHSAYWRTVRKPLLRVGCAVSIILTAMVLFSELVVPFQSLKNARQISIVEVLLQNSATRFASAIMFLGYMGVCGYWAIFQFHVFDLFVVVPRTSDAASLCFVVTFLTRLVLPLCYNFLWIADLTNQQPQLVTYSEVFGRMDVVDFLGKWFNQFMPVFIPVLAILIEAKVIHRFLQWVGVEGFETGEESDIVRRQGVEEGRAIVAREANRELHAVKMMPHSHSSSSESTNANNNNAPNSGSPSAQQPPSAISTSEQDEKRRRYETWKMAHGGGAEATIDIKV